MDRKRLASTARFVAETFAPLLIFWAFEHAVSLFAAIVSGIVCGLLLVALQVAREKTPSPFTLFIAASVVGFGVLDLRYQTGFFVKLEPALGNALTAAFFVGSVLWGKPVVAEFAERAMGRKLERARRYLTPATATSSSSALLLGGGALGGLYLSPDLTVRYTVQNNEQGSQLINIGTGAAGSFRVAVLAGPNSYSIYVPSGLQPNVPLFYPVSGLWCGEAVTILADPDNTVVESNESNNAVGFYGWCSY